jgi:arsenite methyltransferase
MKKSDIKKIVRQGYAKIAVGNSLAPSGAQRHATLSSSCCGPAVSGCGCPPSGRGLAAAGNSKASAKSLSKAMGYSDKEMASVPKEANLGLGCGNPIALASLKPGETVLDLGSGPGLDCFLAANKVGPSGKVIGIDMTPEMIAKARNNAKQKYPTIEFRLGEIEKLPVQDNSVDVIISNCVINLSPDKPAVFKEAFRVLKPGGRLMVSDVVTTNQLPDDLKKSIGAYVGCLSGAIMKGQYLGTIKKVGFTKVKILDASKFPIDFMLNDPTAKALADTINLSAKSLEGIGDSVESIKVAAIKPKSK